MKKLYKCLIFSAFCIVFLTEVLHSQITLKGNIKDGESGEDLIGATVSVPALSLGAVTDYEGNFLLKVPSLPVVLKASYTGFIAQDITVSSADQKLDIRLATNAIIIEEAVVKGQRIDEKQKSAPLTVENLDAIAIKETAAVSFYNGLGNLKGVDLTTASIGFTIINTRGFNSTSPVRSLQIIDGVDNQAPGLNFSLGNFLGASELDVTGVDLVAGASGPFYGPNAFNGVISMKTKDPFVLKGLSASVKGGERQLFEGAVRWADAIKNKKGNEFFAYKLNFFHLRAYDWVADNYDPVYNTDAGKYFTPLQNPGRYDAVNRYGDEYNKIFDASSSSGWDNDYGLQQYHRTGYNEIDLVDYNTRNYKAGGSLHFRLKPEQEFESPEVVIASSFGSGTTVYQGDNRFSLKNILFFQNRIELKKKDKYFIRAYATHEDAGDSYDPYSTALRLQENGKANNIWRDNYRDYWINQQKYQNQMTQMGYPKLVTAYDPVTMTVTATFDYAAAEQWFKDHGDLLTEWHKAAESFANQSGANDITGYLHPDSAGFQPAFDKLIRTKGGAAGGTLFFDKSALYHVHGEYKFEPKFLHSWTVGANARWYRPYSEGTIFSDTLVHTYDAAGMAIDSSYRRITNSEFGVYTGVEKKFMSNKLTLAATVRADKNENFDLLFTPAASVVYSPNAKNFLRFSFASAIRNPTLTDQYLFLNVGRAILAGNLNGFDSLYTLESIAAAVEGANQDASKLVSTSIPAIQPEKVKTFEVGYRTTLWDRIYMDAGFFYNIYNDFIGYNIAGSVPVKGSFIDLQKLQIYRIAANSTNQVTTQGFNVGLNYYFGTYYQVAGNYSWNKLNKLSVDDPIIPAFNTPEHKYNVSLSARDLPMLGLKKTGFNITYKWIKGFLFEGSPQFTGFIPTYDMVDAQWNTTLDRIHTTVKVGATNLLNNKQFQTYGGPRIGRMIYASLVYNFAKK